MLEMKIIVHTEWHRDPITTTYPAPTEKEVIEKINTAKKLIKEQLPGCTILDGEKEYWWDIDDIYTFKTSAAEALPVVEKIFNESGIETEIIYLDENNHKISKQEFYFRRSNPSYLR